MALGAGAAGAQVTSGDIAWAQEVLKEKGFDPGRAGGVLNRRTRDALGAFQRQTGLPVSGSLDPATILKLMEGRPVPPSVRALALPGAARPAAPSPAARAEPASPPLPQPAPKPAVRSAPAAAGGDSPVASVRRTDTGTAPPPVRPGGRETQEPKPIASPRTAVTLANPDGGERPLVLPETAAAAFAGSSAAGPPTVPLWVHYGLYGIVGGTFLFVSALWWLSGRTRPRRGPQTPERHTPTLAAPRRGPP